MANISDPTRRFNYPALIKDREILAKYEQIQHGAADRIITFAEKQLDHRHSVEKKVVNSNIKNEHTGLWLAFFLTIGLMIFGFYLVLHDKETAGYFAVFGPVIFHAGNYLYNRRKEIKS